MGRMGTRNRGGMGYGLRQLDERRDLQLGMNAEGRQDCLGHEET